MTYCYSPIDAPAFFPGESDCGLPVAHDLVVKGGGLSGSQQLAISAILIQLHSDARYLDERGWWGDEFQPFAIGSRFWSIGGAGKQSSFKTAKVDEMIRAALAPLISQGIIDEIRIKTVRTVDGVDADVDAVKDGRSLFRTVFNG